MRCTALYNDVINSGIFNDISKKNLLLWLNGKDLARRAHVFIGTKCSYRCVFCYGNTKRSEDFYNYDDIVSYMDFLRDYGMTDIEITGGEPTEFSEIYKLVKNASDMFDNITIISNGSASVDMYKRLSEYVNEFLFSLHGYDEKSHMTITRNRESWKNIHNAIKACSERIIRINTTICRYNYNNLLEHARHVISLEIPNIRAVNYLPMNSWDDALTIHDYSVPYFWYYETLSDAVLEFENNTPNIELSIRYIPFCAVKKNIKKYVKTHIHHAIDHYDWAQELDGKTPHLELLDKNRNESIVNSILQKRKILYSKFTSCSVCKDRDLCDGFQNKQIEREYEYKEKYKQYFS